MTKCDLVSNLYRYSSVEKKLYLYYEKNNALSPLDGKTLSLSDEINLHIGFDTNPNSVHTGSADSFTLNENLFISAEDDVLISKHPRYTPPFEHKHTFFELIFIYDGECTNCIDGQDLHMKSGDLCIVPPNVSHSLTVLSDTLLLNILIRTTTFQEIFGTLNNSENILSEFFTQILYTDSYRKYLLFHTGDNEKLRNLILDMFLQQINSLPFKKQVINGLFITFCGYLLQEHIKDVEYPPDYYEKFNVMPQIMNYLIHTHQTVTLESLSDKFHIEKNYLSKLIHKQSGKSFKTIVTDIRMEKAAQLLTKDFIKVSQISELLGYNDSNYFMKAFKKYYNCTPSEYREKCKLK